MATSSVFTFSLLRSLLPLLLVSKCSLAVQNINIYHKYYVIDSCTDDENIIYELSNTGIHSVAKIGAFRTSQLHYGARNCTVTIKPPSGYSVYLQVEAFRFGYLYNRTVGCSSYIQVSGNGTVPTRLCGMLDSLPFTSFTSYGNMTFIFHIKSDYLLAGIGFSLIATAFKTSSCSFPDDFQCYNGRCIWQGLTCDTTDNCGDGSDEKAFGKSECYQKNQVKGFPERHQEVGMSEEMKKALREILNDRNLDESPKLPPEWKPVDIEPFTINPIDINWKVTFSPEIVSYRSSHNISVGAALATAVFVILGAFIRFYCYYQCNQARRRQVLSAVTIIRARSILRPPVVNNATPPPPYETLVNDPEGHPESPPEYTSVSGMPTAPATGSTTNASVPSQHSADKSENVSCGPPPPYEP